MPNLLLLVTQFSCSKTSKATASLNAFCIVVFVCRRIVNDTLRTDVPLLFPPYMIALGMSRFT